MPDNSSSKDWVNADVKAHYEDNPKMSENIDEMIEMGGGK